MMRAINNMEELELTFLAKKIPKDLKLSEKKEMIDIYLPSKDRHPTLRVRKSADKYEITRKQPVSDGDASRQLETTIRLTKAEFDELSIVQGKRVEKTRYIYKSNGTIYEIDVFEGELRGLVLVDVEFASLAEQSAFVMPEWCLADVTQEEFIAGGMLCGKKYSDIESDLKRFEYSRINL